MKKKKTTRETAMAVFLEEISRDLTRISSKLSAKNEEINSADDALADELYALLEKGGVINYDAICEQKKPLQEERDKLYFERRLIENLLEAMEEVDETLRGGKRRFPLPPNKKK